MVEKSGRDDDELICSSCSAGESVPKSKSTSSSTGEIPKDHFPAGISTASLDEDEDEEKPNPSSNTGERVLLKSEKFGVGGVRGEDDSMEEEDVVDRFEFRRDWLELELELENRRVRERLLEVDADEDDLVKVGIRVNGDPFEV